MKNILFFLLTFLMMSCSFSSFQRPDEDIRLRYNRESKRIRIAGLIDQSIEDESQIRISVNPKSAEALELMRFLVPLLHDKKQLNLSFWFLEGNSDTEIMAYLGNVEGALTAEELLFNSDPRLTGYEEYKNFLLDLQKFYLSLEDPETMIIGSQANSFIHFALYTSELVEDGRQHFLLHSPLLINNKKWVLPFSGHLYFMMIHDWPIQQYSAIRVKESLFDDMFLNKYDKSENRTAGSYIDAIILMSYPESYSSFTALSSFVNEENIARALKFFPKQIIREKTKPASYLVNKKIERKHKKLSKNLLKLYSKILEWQAYQKE